MFKRPPIILVANFILFFISICFLKNSILFFFLILAIYFVNRYTVRKKYYLFLTAILTISVWNLLFGKFTIILQASFLIIYIIELIKYFTKIDIFYIYDSLFPFVNRKFLVLILSFFDSFGMIYKNCQTLFNINKRLGYQINSSYFLYAIRKCILTVKNSESRYKYERSLYLNADRNKYDVYLSYQDILASMLHVLFLVIVYYLGRSPYAIFY